MNKIDKIIKDLYTDIKINLFEFENSRVDWERELFKITKNLYEQEILPTLLEKIETNAFDRDFIFHNIFRQILIESWYMLEKNDTYIFEYQKEKNYDAFNIIQQLTSKRKIILKKKEADEFIRFVLTVPATLVHFLQTNNSKWLRTYILKNQELIKISTHNSLASSYRPAGSKNKTKEDIISKIKEAKNNLRQKNPVKKISISAVAKELTIADSTFREFLKTNNINFSDL